MVDPLIDSGVYGARLTGEQWMPIQPEGAHGVLELKRSTSRWVPDGATKMLEMLERVRD